MTLQPRIEKLPPAVEWDRLPLMLDETHAAAALGTSVSFLRKSRCEGCKKATLETANDEDSAPPFVKVGGRVFYRTSDLKEWVDCLATRRVI